MQDHAGAFRCGSRLAAGESFCGLVPEVPRLHVLVRGIRVVKLEPRGIGRVAFERRRRIADSLLEFDTPIVRNEDVELTLRSGQERTVF
jgi:hypothetical protein